MSEKTPSFTVTDRRKFNLDGEPRESESAQEGQPEATSAQQQASNVMRMPDPAAGPAHEEAPPPKVEGPPPPTSSEVAAQNAAYQQSSRDLDTMLQQANPGLPLEGAVTFDHVIQSFYLSALMAMGAGTEPGQKPRIDIIGARQSIDMLSVLKEKTQGNLSQKERQLMEGALFELRMMFLEITNAIAKSAQNPPPPKK